MNLSILTKNLNNTAKLYQIENFTIPEEDILKAITCINELNLNSTLDCLLFLTSLNLCNAYVKKNPQGLTYTFKKGIEYLIKKINLKNIPNIKINVIKEHGNLYLFQIMNIQYSFHNDMNIDINNFYKDSSLRWDKIRKQPVALLLFNEVLNTRLEEELSDDNLKEKIELTLYKYRNKTERIEKLKQIHI